MKTNKFIYIFILILTFIAGMTAHYWLSETQLYTKEINEKKILYWVAPMDPNYRRDKPGKSPMGMDLIPVYENKIDSENDETVSINPIIEQNLGVKTSIVKKQDISRVIDTVGSITSDENQIEHIHVYTEGWIRQLFVKAEGDYVKKGQLLFRMYAPSLINAQREYIIALQNKNSILQEAGIQKLKSLGFSDEQMKSLKQNKKPFELIDVYAEQSGIISKHNVNEGMFIKPEKIIMVIEDLSKIWLIAEIYENQSNWVKKNQIAEMSLPYIPGKIWRGKIDYVYPELDPKSLTLKVRMSFDNKSGDLKINMLGNVKIFTDPYKEAIIVPKETIIYTGKETRVVTKLSQGKYRTRLVKIGIESDNMIQIIDGLQEGDVVVTSAQFLIDSESSLNASFNRIDHNDSHNH